MGELLTANRDETFNRIVLGLSYHGGSYQGWQSQSSGRTVQDKLEAALLKFTTHTLSTTCAGRTDARVHALMQVVHFDTALDRSPSSWVRGLNAWLEKDITVHWATMVDASFHSRASAISRRYRYVLLESPNRPSIEAGLVGWSFRPLDGRAMQSAAYLLLGEHDFSSFRASECQSHTPIKTIHRIHIDKRGAYWFFEFEANAFLHHMIRNIMGCLVAVGTGARSVQWMGEVLAAKNRQIAAPTFSANGLYFLGPTYDAKWGIPDRTPTLDAFIGT